MANEPKPPRPKPSALGKPPPRPERQAAFRVGISAESRAAAFLVAKGFRILARRWRSPAGEIDIVARRKHLLIFVEVKARADFDAAAEAVSLRQQQRIVAFRRAGDRDPPGPSAPRRHPIMSPASRLSGASPQSIP